MELTENLVLMVSLELMQSPVLKASPVARIPRKQKTSDTNKTMGKADGQKQLAVTYSQSSLVIVCALLSIAMGSVVVMSRKNLMR
ncbi:MAG: hypothetical protein Q4P66_09895 [Actinomycetaceae bacterium]|nr:hypothetical protein [Actinomycetaceae bacterium]